MLVCNVSMRPKRSAIAGELTEAAAATDAPTTGTVLATLVDDPAAVTDTVDAYLGSIMFEAAAASDALDGSIGPLVTTTWNPADISTYSGTSWPTFTSGNLAVQTSAGNNQAVRGTTAKTGKIYLEFTWNSVSGANPDTVGITTGSNNIDNLALSWTNEIGAASNGNIYRNGSSIGSLGATVSSGQTICIAADLTAKQFWARINGGVWNNSGANDPATGVGGIDFSAIDLSSGAYAFAILYFTPDKVTVNFGATAFTQTVPTGFSAWG